MSSLYAAEQFSKKILNNILELSKAGTFLAVDELAGAVLKSFDKEAQQIIISNGGKAEIKRIIYSARTRGYLNDLVTSEKGYQKMVKINTSRLIFDEDKWDGGWSIVTFDIPSTRDKHRAALRRLIIGLGFINLQRSVWICPVECRQEIEDIQKAYGSKVDIVYIRSDYMQDSDKLLTRYLEIN